MELASSHADSLASVERWYALAKAARWNNLVDVRKVLPHADLVGDKTVFNIKGNTYRLVVHIRYDVGIIYIKNLLTHSEYDKGNWHND
ncbi:MAG TPA: type II toxin-antitoxin system HigB family toxin [Chloroflexota bacterium]|nr:type II toxin-antitoxin system HigB family toxin [Chloroflexota bacterium]